MLNLIWTILMGALTGYIAGIIMKSQGGWLRNIIIGIIGGFISGLIFGSTTLIGGLILSIVCTCGVIFVWEKVIKK
ncbi:MAG: GlsB/YeaQ/YmgE family stress response membrane protein [Lachnospiraceae bacterium]|nr:GlsB/YeaQ/YmgE family stress response membrane protein [Lachnospiraceae bacterium]